MDSTAIVVAVITALLGVIAGVIGTAYKSRKALESEYDIDLRKARVDVYKKLWAELEVLALYSPEPFSRHTAQRLSVALRSWYFRHGGIFLSSRARNAYFDLQEALVQALERTDDPAPLRELLRRRGSALRTAMTDDIATRVPPRLVREPPANADVPDDARREATSAAIERELARANETGHSAESTSST
jgi:hypothetical protein